MAAALKLFTRGTLTFCEIAIVVFFIATLATMAVVACLVARKGNRPSGTPGKLLVDFASAQDAA